MSQSLRTPVVFVTSATGSQGGALCRELRQLGWNVRATTRDLESPKARALQALGVHLTLGGWDDEAALRAALSGCDKLFLCLLPNLMDLDQAPRRAHRIITIAKAAGVCQAVVSTTLGAFMLEEATQPPVPLGSFFTRHLQSKKRVEQAVIEGRFQHWTVLRPAFFMANFLAPKIDFGYAETRDKGSWTNSLKCESLLSLVDHVDIARFAAAAFLNPDKFHQRLLGLASDQLPVQDMLDQLSESIGDGRSLKALFMSDQEIKEAMAQDSWQFFSAEPCVRYCSDYIDMSELSRLLPGLTTFKKYLERENEGVKETYISSSVSSSQGCLLEYT
ncbi:NmrA family protein [Xylariaceae sp. FL0662B]|nr:NmrA family protein [Xylariaceae sp. FL0662B]